MEIREASYVAGIVDGEGSISLTRMHDNEYRRPCISIASTDKELLLYIKELTGGIFNNKKNYKPSKHQDSFTLSIKKKDEVFYTLQSIIPFLRVKKTKSCCLDPRNYDTVTARNGKYSPELLK